MSRPAFAWFLALVLPIVLSACLPVEGIRRHRVTGRLVTADGTPVADRDVVVVADPWRWRGRTVEEQFAMLATRQSAQTDDTGRFVAETATMTTCLANVPAGIVLGIPILTAERLAGRDPGDAVRSSKLLCAILCTGVGCGAPEMRHAVLLTKRPDGVVGLPLRSRFLTFVAETRTATGAHDAADWVACHEADDVVVPAGPD